MTKKISLLAVVCARNESLHIQRCFRSLLAQGFEVVLLDHDSVDGTYEIAQQFLGNGLLRIERLPWQGYFSLEDQLLAKQKIISDVNHDWVAHFDADECPQSTAVWDTLEQVVSSADSSGYNCINFNEIVVLPPPSQVTFDLPAFDGNFLDYYFFQPNYPRLMRLWRRDAGFYNLLGAGHTIDGSGLRLFPQDQILKHYIVLSLASAKTKYLSRVFNSEELARGWHANRAHVKQRSIEAYFSHVFDADSRLFRLDHPNSSAVNLSAPQLNHFWDWL